MHAYTAQDIERIARRRAGARLGWILHACVYLCVMTLLGVLAALGGRHWAVFPAFGWGIGLLVHGLAVFLSTGGFGLKERLVDAERARLQATLDRA